MTTFPPTTARRPRFSRHESALGRPFYVADRLWRIPPRRALATVTNPGAASGTARASLRFDLRDHQQRQQCYEILLVDGSAEELATWIDGLFLVELWDALSLPRTIRLQWQPVIDEGWDD